MLIVLAAAAALGSSPSPFGLWDAPTDRSRVRVAPCGPKICGFVVSSNHLAAHPDLRDARNADAALRGRPIRGLEIMEVAAADAGAFKGWVYDPDSGRTYRVTVRMTAADRLAITGCLVGPLCRTEDWTRAPAG